MLVEVLSIRVRAEELVGELADGVIDVFIAVVIVAEADIIVICGRVDMLANAKVIALDVTGIDLEFALPSSYAVDVLRDSWDEAIGNIDVSIDVRVNMLIDVLAVGVLV